MPAVPKTCTILILAGTAAYWLLLFAGTHAPGNVVNAGGNTDKVYHFFAFFGLTILLCGSMASFRRPGTALYATIVGLVAAYGIFDELTQMLIPNRTADPLDWLADMSGAILGVLTFSLLHRLFCPCKEAQGATG
ncbi:MAG: VanZ family protein [Planctomycetales bacterium]|nr:VanZ family protein [Planctomycetales bacterium]